MSHKNGKPTLESTRPTAEVWRPLPLAEFRHYSASSFGRIRSHMGPLKLTLHDDYHLYVSIKPAAGTGGKRAHVRAAKCVWGAFTGEWIPNGKTIAHIDGENSNLNIYNLKNPDGLTYQAYLDNLTLRPPATVLPALLPKTPAPPDNKAARRERFFARYEQRIDGLIELIQAMSNTITGVPVVLAGETIEPDEWIDIIEGLTVSGIRALILELGHHIKRLEEK